MSIKEIELKNLLTEAEFQLLLHYFNLKKDDSTTFKTFYLDTPDLRLKKLTSALRIRQYLTESELTLKQKTNNLAEHLETTQKLSNSEAQNILKTLTIPKGIVSNSCPLSTHEQKKLKHLGTMTTTRYEKNYLNGIIALDTCNYLNITDFELEYEVTDYQRGLENFKKILSENNIPIRITENKIKRLMNASNKN